MVVHIMQPAIRDYYRLEELWGDKEVKLGAAKRGKRSASEEEAPKTRSRASVTSRASQTTLDDDEPRKPARKSAARKTADGAPAKTARKTASKTAGKTAGKTAAKSTRVPTGGTVKVAATKTARAPRKTAAKKTAG
jgi:ribosome-associated protein